MATIEKFGQWKVVDANFLRDPELENFFRASPGNRAVFNEFNCMEFYKGDALRNIRFLTEITSRYPSQVVVLKGAPAIIALQASGPTRPTDFVDVEQTRSYPHFCRSLRAAVNGHAQARAEVLQHGEAADKQLAVVRADSRKFAEGVLLLAKSYDPDFVRQLRRRELPDGAGPAIIKGALELTGAFLSTLPGIGRVPQFHELPDSFVFRYALMGQLLAMRWITDGGIQTVKPERLGNDLVDMSHAVYATYFDGLLTRERKWLELYDDASWFFREGLSSWAPVPAEAAGAL